MKTKNKKNIPWRHIIILAILVFAVYVLTPRLSAFSTSFEHIKQANFAYLFLALSASLTAVLCAALTYKQLIFKPIAYTRIASVQYAGMFINRLVPAGVGGISLFIDFLYRQGHTLARASGVVAMNTALGLFGHFSVVLGAIVVCGTVMLPSASVQYEKLAVYAGAVFLAVAIVVLIVQNTKPLGKVSTFVHQLSETLLFYKARKVAVLRAWLCAMLNTGFHATSLYLAMLAFGVDLHAGVAIIVLTGGVFAATVTPTPGGVLGAEAGLTAMLMAYGIEASTAFAIAVSYRLVSYWIPILPGILAFIYVQKRKYI